MKKLIILILIFSFSFANNCNNKLFSLSTQGSSTLNLKTIISDLSDTCNLNIIIADDLAKSKIDTDLSHIKLNNVTLTEFLNHILGDNGFFYNIKNNTLTISYIKTKTFKIDYINSIFTGASTFSASSPNNTGTTSGSNTLNSTFSFDFWTDFTKNIQTLLASQNTASFTSPLPVIDKNSGLVTITGTKRQLDYVSNYIKEVNKRLHKQVFIDVKIYSVKLSKTNRTGVDWSNFSLKMSTGDVATRGTSIATTILGANTFNLSGLLNFLSNYGEVNSISNPKITTLNNQKAIITVGQTKNYSYKTVTKDANGNALESDTLGSKFIGILVDITPEISDNGVISLAINPSISSIDPTQLNPNLPPDTFEKKLTTMVRVKDNQTIILGGLITDEKSFTENGVNLLKEIPVIKYLFSGKTALSNREELVFVITPHIINLNKNITIKNAGYGKLPNIGEF